jgi:hypothetical protein
MFPHFIQTQLAPNTTQTRLNLKNDLRTSPQHLSRSIQKLVHLAGIASISLLLTFPALATDSVNKEQPRKQGQNPSTIIQNQTIPDRDRAIPLYCYRSQRSLSSRVKTELPECRV